MMGDVANGMTNGMTTGTDSKDELNALMQNPEFLARFQQMTPDEQKAFIANNSVDYAGRQGVLDSDLARAQALRDTATPEGRRAGGMYVAANPLEHIGTGLNRYAGMKGLEAAREGMGDLSTKKELGLSSLMEMFGK